MVHLILSLFLGLWPATAGLLCRFTVRDVAFCDLGDGDYRLQVFARSGAGRGGLVELRRRCAALFADSNVHAEVFDAASRSGHPALAKLPPAQRADLPLAILHAPGERTLAIPLGAEAAQLGALIDSPLRARLLAEIIDRFCIILLVSSGDPQADARAAGAAKEACARIESIFSAMPKAVGELPLVLTLKADQRSAERVALWSLGVALDDPEPLAAVLFGRGRRIGQLLRGAAISAEALYRILAIAGASCECDLDRAWMRGPRIPLRWDGATRARAAQVLGFDPQSPMVRAEILGILHHGPGAAGGAPPGGSSIDEILLGYSEQEVPTLAASEPAPSEAARSPERAPTPGQPPEESSPWKLPLIALAALALLSLAAGAAIALRARMR